MSKEIIRKEIDQIIETINEQWEIIRAYERKIPLIEMDIFMGNIRTLYNDLSLLDKINKAPGFDPDRIKSQITREPSIFFETGTKPKPEIKEIKEEPIDRIESQINSYKAVENDSHAGFATVNNKPEQSEPVSAPVILSEEISETEQEGLPEPFNKPEQSQPVARNQTEEPVTETSPALNYEKPPSVISTKSNDPDFEIHTYSAPEQKESTPPPVPDLFGSHITSLADKFQAEKKSVKDQFTVREDHNSLGNRMQQSQITDLKSAIGINEKFLFINELFKGDLAGYNQSIETLNACQSRQEAIDKLNEMRIEFSWPDNSSSFLRLNDFLKRRHTM